MMTGLLMRLRGRDIVEALDAAVPCLVFAGLIMIMLLVVTR